MKQILYILTFILISHQSIACICPIQKDLIVRQNNEFENSECIFIGDVLKIDTKNNEFTIRVIESFDGDDSGNTYKGVYDEFCGPIIDEKGKWLIYGSFNSNNQIEINACGLTRSINKPENGNGIMSPPKPLPPEKKENPLIIDIDLTEQKLRAQSELKNEIISLRRRKRI